MSRQTSFAYSFVARGRVVLAEFTESDRGGNLSAVAVQWLPRLPATNRNNERFTSNRDDHSFNFLVEDGYVYCVVAKESVSGRLSFAFLERTKAEFKQRYGGGRADGAPAKSLTKEFGPIMKEKMKYVIEHAEEIDKVSQVEAQISQVKSITLDNINKVMDRGEKLTVLEDKTTDLRDQAQLYKKQGNEIKRKMWYQNVKIKLAVIVILLLIIGLIAWLSACSGFNCSK
ncbi:vesicle-associated membrane protein 724-like [Punica granatum]|uniref:Vesicle-associated membrane protein 724-like n=1 Tax=Punica granatum TaxID=22663 RepID=A0A6P8DTZ0_PUNGR|nr:vesicle-associated membrane protein 724-like [Punica granatum]